MVAAAAPRPPNPPPHAYITQQRPRRLCYPGRPRRTHGARPPPRRPAASLVLPLAPEAATNPGLPGPRRTVSPPTLRPPPSRAAPAAAPRTTLRRARLTEFKAERKEPEIPELAATVSSATGTNASSRRGRSATPAPAARSREISTLRRFAPGVGGREVGTRLRLRVAAGLGLSVPLCSSTPP